MKVLLLKRRYIYIIILLALIIAGIIFLSARSISAPAFSDRNEEPVLILDPGHGGEDGGAVSVTGTYESDINLSVSLKLRDLAGLYGIPVVMTRDSGEIVYPDSAVTVKSRKKADQDARIALINSYDNAVLVSIHQNKYTSAEPFGAQTLYGKAEGSRELAEITQNTLTKYLNSENYRKISDIPESIYLFKNIKCRSVLVECGFLSNQNEAALLDTDSYRLKIASAVLSSYINYLGVEK